MQRNSRVQHWRAHSLSDTEDASSTFNGAMASLANIIPDPQTAKVWYCRPAAILTVNFNAGSNPDTFTIAYGAPLIGTLGFISALLIIGDIAYGMIAGGKGNDVPFTYNLQTNTLNLPTGVTAANTPASPATTGTWVPPTMSLVGALLVVTHPGFNGSGGNFFGWFDLTNPALPVWNAGNLTGAYAFTTVPTAVAQFNGRAYYITNVPAQPAVVFSDALAATTVTNANQILTFGDNAILTALAGLPLFNQLGGVIQSLIVFKGVTNVYQITGDSSKNNLSINSLNIATGTLAPKSIVPTPKGLFFSSPEGIRYIDFYAKVSDPIGFDGNGVTSPFSQSVVPSRISAGCNGSLYRVTTQNGGIPSTPQQELWYDMTRQVWSGPHTSTCNQIQPWRGTFIIAPITQLAKLYQSDPIQTNTSTYTEFGAALNWVWQTPLLPDTDELVNVCMTEATLDLAFAPMATYSCFFSDQNGALVDSLTVSSTGTATIWGSFTWGIGLWGGAANMLAPIRMPWHFPIVFARGSYQAQGASAQQVRIGALHMRYQTLRQWASIDAAA